MARIKHGGEGMLPPHIFKKKKEKNFEVDKISKIFPEFAEKENEVDNSDLINEIEELKAENGQLKDEIIELTEKLDKKIGTKKALIEENEALKKDIEELLNSEDTPDDSPKE